MEAVVLNRVGFLEYFCPKQGQDFKPLAAPLYPNMGHHTLGEETFTPRYSGWFPVSRIRKSIEFQLFKKLSVSLFTVADDSFELRSFKSNK